MNMPTTVFRVERTKDYVVMSNKFLRNRAMSLKAKGLLALCLSLPDSWEYSINGLVAISKESQTAIRSTLKELEKFGHLRRNRLKDDKGQFFYEYVIFETPHTGFAHTDKRHTEKAHKGNNRQQSNKRQTIKKQNNNNNNSFMNELKDLYEGADNGK
jgi:hypothetical protein